MNGFLPNLLSKRNIDYQSQNSFLPEQKKINISNNLVNDRIGLNELNKITTTLAPTLPDLITLTSYGLGIWWSFGGPRWAAFLSVLGDELDGRIARLTNTATERGSSLDWGTDVALVPLSLFRFGKTIGHPYLAMALAPPILFSQAHMRGKGYRPAFGSPRAFIMLSTVFLEWMQKRKQMVKKL